MAFAEFAPYFNDVDAIFCGVINIPADERYQNSKDKIGIQFIIGMCDAKPKDGDRRLKLSPSQIYESGGGPNLVIKFSPEEFTLKWAKFFKSALPGTRWSLELGMGALALVGGTGSSTAISLFTLLAADSLA